MKQTLRTEAPVALHPAGKTIAEPSTSWRAVLSTPQETKGHTHGLCMFHMYWLIIYRRSGNFCCKNIFVVCVNHENKKHEIYFTTNNNLMYHKKNFMDSPNHKNIFTRKIKTKILWHENFQICNMLLPVCLSCQVSRIVCETHIHVLSHANTHAHNYLMQKVKFV